MSCAKPLIIGIDATNLRRGGGVTHLVELLETAEPKNFGVERLIVWGGQATLDALNDRSWLEKYSPPATNKGLFQRIWWQRFSLSKLARAAKCDVLFVPGGSYAGNFHPVITMSQNMLPFEWRELKRYGWSLLTFKLLLLRLVQSNSYRKADGIIFLTNYAKDKVTRITGALNARSKIIPHGLNPRFNHAPKFQHKISYYDDKNPYRVLYVSIVDQYKHQWHVVEAIETLRKEGFPVVLDLIGPAYNPALDRLKAAIVRLGDDHKWVRYHGAIPFGDLHFYYKEANMGLFASSCENLPNILLETMVSGLPIACSNRGPMPEVLGDGGVYFDPEKPAEITNALRKLISSPQLRTELANNSYQKAQEYSWKRCALETFQFLVKFAQTKA